ncbi:hypothetical protein BpHYR1_052113 [Brachionus plicatilis]|uniref:Uncharacterized protein n=1 Tax=Brachionus plicatilis TaxID=10195 RepID=A0A3M7RPZ9_BRAPC|nr:hypothetical protein BpHYR1_052113 [Brachionus plicatilis]
MEKKIRYFNYIFNLNDNFGGKIMCLGNLWNRQGLNEIYKRNIKFLNISLNSGDYVILGQKKKKKHPLYSLKRINCSILNNIVTCQ